MAPAALSSGPSFDAERIKLYESKTTPAVILIAIVAASGGLLFGGCTPPPPSPAASTCARVARNRPPLGARP